jgi:hypothetical protein
MAGKTDFTEDEWKELQQGVTGAGLLVSTRTPRLHGQLRRGEGRRDSNSPSIAESESQLVRDLSATHSTGFGLVASRRRSRKGRSTRSGASVALLGEKAPDELEAYRALVLDVATAVAEAKGG